MDANAYSASLTHLFMAYSPEVVEQVTRELPWKLKWFPSLQEVKEALEDATDPGRKFRVPDSHSTPNTFRDDVGPRKRVPNQQFRGCKVYEDGKLVSSKFGGWNGKDCIAKNDPVRPPR